MAEGSGGHSVSPTAGGGLLPVLSPSPSPSPANLDTMYGTTTYAQLKVGVLLLYGGCSPDVDVDVWVTMMILPPDDDDGHCC